MGGAPRKISGRKSLQRGLEKALNMTFKRDGKENKNWKKYRREYQLLQVSYEVDAFWWDKLRQAVTTARPGRQEVTAGDASYRLEKKSLFLCP